MTSVFSPVIGRAYRVAKRPTNDEHAHVTVTDVYARDRETVIVFMDGFGSSRTMTLGAFCDFLGIPALKPIPPHTPDVRPMSKDAIVEEVTRNPRATDFAPAGVLRTPAAQTIRSADAPAMRARPSKPPVDF